jgi:hypothetical protein
MEIEVLVSRIEIIKEIKTFFGIGLVEATQKYDKVIEFIESKQELTFNIGDPQLFMIFRHLRDKKILAFKTEDELKSDEEKANQKEFILKHNEALLWKHSLCKRELELLETLIQASQVICSAE